MAATLQPVYGLICDDVRNELHSKQTIVGVYIGGIQVPALPHYQTLSFWVALIWSGDGTADIEFRVVGPSKETCGEEKGPATAVLQGLETSIAVKVFVEFKSEGMHEIQIRDGALRPWQTVKNFAVVMPRTG